jgi:hypothetical protein
MVARKPTDLVEHRLVNVEDEIMSLKKALHSDIPDQKGALARIRDLESTASEFIGIKTWLQRLGVTGLAALGAYWWENIVTIIKAGGPR